MAQKKSSKQKNAARVRQQAAAQRAAVEAKQGVSSAPVTVDEEAAKAAAAAEKEAARQKRIEERQAELAKKQKAAEKEQRQIERKEKKLARKDSDDVEAYRKDSKVEKKPNIFVRLWNYLKAVRVELKRVTWPSKAEVAKMSFVVIVALIFFGLLFYAVDSILTPLLLLYAGIG